jgi:hypothetical protein
MFRTIIYGLAALLAASLASAQGTPAAAPPPDENAVKARTMINQAIEAMGGQAYLKALEKSSEGRFYSFTHGRPNSYGAPYGQFSKYPDKDRVEIIKRKTYFIPTLFGPIVIDSVKAKDKKDIVVIHNGDKGYETTYKGTAAEPAKDTATYLRQRNYSLAWVLRKWINEPGVGFFYEGTGLASDKAADKVTLINAQNEAVTLYLDQTSHLPLKKSYTWRDPDGYKNTEDEVYDNYREVQGVMTPFTITRYFNDQMSYQTFLTKVVFNQGFPDELFQATVTYDARSGAQVKP